MQYGGNERIDPTAQPDCVEPHPSQPRWKDGPVMWPSLFGFPVPLLLTGEKAISPSLTKIRTELPSHTAGH